MFSSKEISSDKSDISKLALEVGVMQKSDSKHQTGALRAALAAGAVAIGAALAFNAVGTHQEGDDIPVVVGVGDTETSIINEICSQVMPEEDINYNASRYETEVIGSPDSNELFPGNTITVRCMANGGFLTELFND